GVGILRSAASQSFLRSIGTALNLYGEDKLLQKVFDGSVGASTEIPGRGRGLPTMKTYADQGLLPGLQVLTSGVRGSVEHMNFKSNGERLRGTLFRWRSDPLASES